MASLLAPQIDVIETLDPADEGTVAAMFEALDAVPQDALLHVVTPSGAQIEISAGVRHFLEALHREMARGHTVVLASAAEQEVSTGAAAELLGVSRPHVVTLIDRGILHARKVRAGDRSHRRLRISDVLAYKRQVATAGAALLVMDADAEDLEALDRAVPPRAGDGMDDVHPGTR